MARGGPSLPRLCCVSGVIRAGGAADPKGDPAIVACLAPTVGKAAKATHCGSQRTCLDSYPFAMSSAVSPGSVAVTSVLRPPWPSVSLSIRWDDGRCSACWVTVKSLVKLGVAWWSGCPVPGWVMMEAPLPKAASAAYSLGEAVEDWWGQGQVRARPQWH